MKGIRRNGYEMEHVKEDNGAEAFGCPAGGRSGYDFVSLEGCNNCPIGPSCARRAMKIEKAFDDF